MKLRLIISLLLFATWSYADEARIVIKQKSGNETTLELSTNPVITFEGEEMVITNDFTRISFPLDDVDNYTANNGTTTGITPVKANPQIMDGRIIFSSVPKGTPIYVYSLDGRIVNQLTTDAFGKAEVSLKSLAKGTYIISAEKSKIKVINK
ncbi:MAG: T9SS type A sorting domain-containing protein [Prevotella sp.]|nr:T9SS type A sorting domain-containing protein [Prevotella sp.]